jgi:hypothetical protein
MLRTSHQNWSQSIFHEKTNPAKQTLPVRDMASHIKTEIATFGDETDKDV